MNSHIKLFVRNFSIPVLILPICLILVSLLFTDKNFLTAQTTEVGIGVYPGDSNYTTLPKRSFSDKEKKFTEKASAFYQIDKKVIEKLLAEGFYPKEIVRVILISQKTATPIEKIISMRKKRTSFTDICSKLQIDYKNILTDEQNFFSN